MQLKTTQSYNCTMHNNSMILKTTHIYHMQTPKQPKHSFYPTINFHSFKRPFPHIQHVKNAHSEPVLSTFQSSKTYNMHNKTPCI